MRKVLTNLISAAVALTFMSVSTCIRLDPHNHDKPLSSTTIQLLSSFQRCIVFIFDWDFGNDYNSWTSANYYLLYSKSMTCAVVVDSYTEFRNKSKGNPRFEFSSDIWLPQPHPLFTKYTTTLANIYSPETTSHAAYYKATKAPIIALRRYNIPFNYVLFFISNDQTFSSAWKSLPGVSSPAAYIVILDGKDVYLIGISQVCRATAYLFRVDILQEAHIQRLQKVIHKDLQQATLIFSHDEPERACIYPTTSTYSTSVCVGLFLAKHFNTTLCNLYFSSCKDEISQIGPAAIPRPDRLNSFVRKANWNLEFVKFGEETIDFSFICVVETKMLGLRAFLQAFDLSTWLITMATCTFMAATITAMSTKASATLWIKLQKSAVVVLMLLIERFYSHSGVIRTGSRQLVFVITLWAFGALLLGMCYSGNMVSELTSPSLPSLPRDMQELSLVNYPIFTFSWVLHEDLNSTIQQIPALPSKIDEYLSHHGGQNSTLMLTLRRMRKAVSYIHSPASMVSARNDKSSRVLFAYADTTYNIKGYEIGSVMQGTNTRTLRGGHLPFFTHQARIILHSNFLAPIFQSFSGKVFASGVYEYWHKGCKAEDVKLIIVKEMKTVQVLAQKVNLATIWQDFEPLLNVNSWSAINLESSLAAFQLFGIGALLSLIVMMHERWPFQEVLFAVLTISRNVVTIALHMFRHLAILLLQKVIKLVEGLIRALNAL